MSKSSVTTPVKGGVLKRNAATGRFVEVRSATTVSKPTRQTEFVLKETASKRNSALKRLADR